MQKRVHSKQLYYYIKWWSKLHKFSTMASSNTQSGAIIWASRSPTSQSPNAPTASCCCFCPTMSNLQASMNSPQGLGGHAETSGHCWTERGGGGGGGALLPWLAGRTTVLFDEFGKFMLWRDGGKFME